MKTDHRGEGTQAVLNQRKQQNKTKQALTDPKPSKLTENKNKSLRHDMP
jgi:hypothetical protein